MIRAFKHDIEELTALVNLGTLREKVAERKSAIKDLVMQIEDMEKEAKLVTYATT